MANPDRRKPAVICVGDGIATAIRRVSEQQSGNGEYDQLAAQAQVVNHLGESTSALEALVNERDQTALKIGIWFGDQVDTLTLQTFKQGGQQLAPIRPVKTCSPRSIGYNWTAAHVRDCNYF